MSDFFELDLTYFVYIGGLVGVLLLMDALRQLLMKNRVDVIVRTKRLKMLSQGKSTEEILGTLRRETPKNGWSWVPLLGTIPGKMQQAGFEMKPQRFLLLCFAMSVVAYGIGQFTVGTLPAIALGVTFGIGLPLAVIEVVRRKRINTFAGQLPEALELMKRGLSVGHPLNVSIANVAKTMPDPIGTEFGLVADQIAYGENLTDAFQDLAQRINQEDMHYLAASVSIQHGTGGNLGTMFGTLARVIRGRFALRRKVKALSSEGRASATLLSSLPFAMYATTTFTSPDYYSGVSGERMFLYMAIAVVVLVVGNALFLRKLVNFRI